MAYAWLIWAQKRTKLCGRCKATLAWKATYCDACGAGTPPPPGLFERLVRPYLWWVFLLGVLAVLMVGGSRFLEHLEQVEQEVSQLQDRRLALVAQVDRLKKQKGDIEEKARGWAQLARNMHSVDLYDREESCRATAEELFDQAESIGESLDAAKVELGAVEAEIRKLGAGP